MKFLLNGKGTNFIFGQNDAVAFKMGVTTSDVGGCGWVAIYNTLKLLGNYEDPAEIIYWLETHGGLNLYGLLGINPVTIMEYLQHKGYSTHPALWAGTGGNYFADNADDMIRNHGPVILAFGWSDNGIGLHYVTIKYSATAIPSATPGGIGTPGFLIYNEYNNKTQASKETSVQQWFSRENHLFLFATFVS